MRGRVRLVHFHTSVLSSGTACAYRSRMMSATFLEFLEARRADIDARLDAALPPRPGLPERLRDAMRYSLLAPGKRLRPLLVLLAAEACGSHRGDPWPAAVAVEMVHVYSLIHD